MSDESHALLDEFGRLFARQFDYTMEELKTALTRSHDPAHKKDSALRQYLQSNSEDMRAMKLAGYAIQKFSHNLFSELDASEKFALFADADTAEPVDIKQHSDLFASEPDEWLEKYSKHGSIAARLLAIAETMRRDFN